MKPSIFAVIPAYNEEARIRKVIHDISPYVSRIIVIDDGSADRTPHFARGKKVTLLKHVANLGQGAALQTGLDYAKSQGARIVITYDADGQFNAKDIPPMVKPILQKEVDIVLGSRFKGKSINIPFTKYLTLKLGLIFTRLFTELPLTDTYNGFRVLGSTALQKITITQNRMVHPLEIIEQIKKHHLRYTEIPVTISYDQYTIRRGDRVLNPFQIFFEFITKKYI